MSEVPVNIEAVARHYHGEPNSRLSKTNELRFGTHGSLSVDLVKNTWFSFEDDVGGGVADLVRREEGDNANVAKILQEKFGAERYRQIDLEEAIARAKGDNWFAPLTSDDLPLDSPHDQFLGWSAADRANTAQSRFNVHTLDGLAQLPEPEFLIDGLLIEGTDVVLYGPSEAMKTGTAIRPVRGDEDRDSYLVGGRRVTRSGLARTRYKRRLRDLRGRRGWCIAPQPHRLCARTRRPSG